MLRTNKSEIRTENRVETTGADGSDQLCQEDSIRVKFDVSISKGKTSVHTEIRPGNSSHPMSQASTWTAETGPKCQIFSTQGILRVDVVFSSLQSEGTEHVC